MMIKHILVSIICLLTIASYGQGEHDGNTLYDHDLNEEKWEGIRNDIRYEGNENGPGRQWTYENNREYNKARKESGNGNGNGSGGNGNGNGGGGNGTGGDGSGSSQKPQSDSSPPRSNSGSSAPMAGLGAFGYILLAVFLVGLMVLIYYLFVNAPKKGKKVGQAISLEEINPTEIPLTELQRLLQEALANKDFRGAIRIYFVFIIRDLSAKKLIQWEKEKTNFHYLREMAGKGDYDDFNRSVSYFEIIWYGKREIDEQKFNEIRPVFTNYLDRLGVK